MEKNTVLVILGETAETTLQQPPQRVLALRLPAVRVRQQLLYTLICRNNLVQDSARIKGVKSLRQLLQALQQIRQIFDTNQFAYAFPDNALHVLLHRVSLLAVLGPGQSLFRGHGWQISTTDFATRYVSYRSLADLFFKSGFDDLSENSACVGREDRL